MINAIRKVWSALGIWKMEKLLPAKVTKVFMKTDYMWSWKMREFVRYPFHLKKHRHIIIIALKYRLTTWSKTNFMEKKKALVFKYPFPLEIWQLNLTEMSETSISAFWAVMDSIWYFKKQCLFCSFFCPM